MAAYLCVCVRKGRADAQHRKRLLRVSTHYVLLHWSLCCVAKLCVPVFVAHFDGSGRAAVVHHSCVPVSVMVCRVLLHAPSSAMWWHMRCRCMCC